LSRAGIRPAILEEEETMTPRNLLLVGALACALPAAAFAQSLASAIVGSWAVTTVADQYDNGKNINNWGTVRGNLSFDANGRFMQILVGDVQSGLKGPDPRRPDAPVVAYYGTYSVNEAAKSVTFNIEAASWSPRAGASNTSSVELNGDVMTLVGSARKDQIGTFRPRVELKRVPRL
jgi:hypothetical protein